VLEWVFRRCEGTAEAVDTPIGRVPAEGALNVEGLTLAPGALDTLLTVDGDAVKSELPQVRAHLEQFGETLPREVRAQFETLEERLG
jgi:phosphoenolpyruvate carboxykinase (GTP)